MNNIYWALIGIVSAAIATGIILHIVLKSEDNLDQISDIENPSIATFLGHVYAQTLYDLGTRIQVVTTKPSV
jgi:hypothetical protein